MLLLQRQVTGAGGYNYLLFLPQGYQTEESVWPMILFLHGAGERGSNLEYVKTHGADGATTRATMQTE
ncbi:MAG: hypothetical protein HXY43_07605 [Fischerella sp.]|jgi:predicted peptidase|uniref:hypothetical protein n=1 Tax=Fischerella sp. TaxID=1191 RepID=UPI00184DC9A0|nr:hypothetical protein [Fischerella sp.]NWF59162.1 hypothetical protein [Fischerella sp.]